jgi:non-ribosomal peptide synthetase component F
MVVAILGALMAGKGYVPLDPEWPEARQREVLQDAGVGAILTDHVHSSTAWHLATHHPAEGRPIPRALAVVEVTAYNTGPEVSLGNDVPHVLSDASLPSVPPEAIAYLLYTSGSTGFPKATGTY